jgi:hypothetical protein
MQAGMTPACLVPFMGVVAACSPVRIINVSSAAHMFGQMDFADLQSERDYDRWRAYGEGQGTAWH